MPGPIDEKVRRTICAMLDAGASTGAIVEATGASKATVNRLRSQRGSTKGKSKTKTAQPRLNPRTRACDGSPTQSAQPTQPIESSELSNSRAFKGMVDMIDPLRSQMKASEKITDESKRAYVMTTYADKLIKIYTKIGSWSGLDDPAPAVIAESPIDNFLMEGLDVMKRGKEESDVGSRRASHALRP